MKKNYFPRGVKMVKTSYGEAPEPEFNPKWSDAKKISWQLSLIEATTGLRVEVYDTKSTTNGIPDRAKFGFMFGSMSVGGFDYLSAHDFLLGLESGYITGKQ